MLTKTPTATFIRHYIEMVVVMFAGMIVLGLPGEAALKALGSGTSELRDDAPAVVFLGMAATMTIPTSTIVVVKCSTSKTYASARIRSMMSPSTGVTRPSPP
jgi:hypothetical protein